MRRPNWRYIKRHCEFITRCPYQAPDEIKLENRQGPTTWARGINEGILPANESTDVTSKPKTVVAAEKELDKEPALPVMSESAMDQDAVTAYVLSVVSEKTGYPVDMFDPTLTWKQTWE